MTLNTCELWLNVIKIAFFPKTNKKSPNGWGGVLRPPKSLVAGGPAPNLPSVIHLSYTSFLNTFQK